jgi:hydrogenase maturation protein HypF
MTTALHETAASLEIRGLVQGIGFRPFIYQLACRHGLTGRVANTPEGVAVEVEGPDAAIDAFCRGVEVEKPLQAHITGLVRTPRPPRGFDDFSIAPSGSAGTAPQAGMALISPDMSVCGDCLAELFDPNDRRFGYPFINCTHCGPRYTIIDAIPYDRPHTAMKHFAMCPDCAREYHDPGNRRFHAQPNACAVCGPRVRLCDNRGNDINTDDPIRETATLLKAGHIVAIKGLGGFHLAVDAENEGAVRRLRQRKHREEKPLALISPDIETIQRYAHVGQEEKRLLSSPVRPIVLLRKRAWAIESEFGTGNGRVSWTSAGCACVSGAVNGADGQNDALMTAGKVNEAEAKIPIAHAVAPGNRCFGVMLPYTPLHYLLLSHGFSALVMTSGNRSDEPIVIDNQDAVVRLGQIADYVLAHNRDIYLRSDDSIVRPTADGARILRRSRGYVPVPVFLKHKTPSILACGAALKNIICLTRNDQAFLSQHIGDLDNPRTYAFFRQTIDHLKQILSIKPEIIAHDRHPDYLSTRYALEQPLKGPPRIAVQHHHAHIAGCMAENRIDGPVIGLALDGAGYGEDGNIWGGEVLIADAANFTRAAHLAYAPMPGGEAAIKSPWRMAVSYLHAAFGPAYQNLDLPLFGPGKLGSHTKPGKQNGTGQMADTAAPYMENQGDSRNSTNSPDNRYCMDSQEVRLVGDIMLKNINSPLTSSMGRLFDGVAAIMGLRDRVSFEGQAAMALEMATPDDRPLPRQAVYDYDIDMNAPVWKIDWRPIICGVAADVQKRSLTADISHRFHWTLIHLFADLCCRLRRETGLNRVVLSGGVFQNDILSTGLCVTLARHRFEVFSHRLVPPNDGGIALGQAVVAAAQAATSPSPL